MSTARVEAATSNRSKNCRIASSRSRIRPPACCAPPRRRSSMRSMPSMPLRLPAPPTNNWPPRASCTGGPRCVGISSPRRMAPVSIARRRPRACSLTPLTSHARPSWPLNASRRSDRPPTDTRFCESSVLSCRLQAGERFQRRELRPSTLIPAITLTRSETCATGATRSPVWSPGCCWRPFSRSS